MKYIERACSCVSGNRQVFFIPQQLLYVFFRSWNTFYHFQAQPLAAPSSSLRTFYLSTFTPMQSVFTMLFYFHAVSLCSSHRTISPRRVSNAFFFCIALLTKFHHLNIHLSESMHFTQYTRILVRIKGLSTLEYCTRHSLNAIDFQYHSPFRSFAQTRTPTHKHTSSYTLRHSLSFSFPFSRPLYQQIHERTRPMRISFCLYEADMTDNAGIRGGKGRKRKSGAACASLANIATERGNARARNRPTAYRKTVPRRKKIK